MENTLSTSLPLFLFLSVHEWNCRRMCSPIYWEIASKKWNKNVFLSFVSTKIVRGVLVIGGRIAPRHYLRRMRIFLHYRHLRLLSLPTFVELNKPGHLQISRYRWPSHYKLVQMYSPRLLSRIYQSFNEVYLSFA